MSPLLLHGADKSALCEKTVRTHHTPKMSIS
jgi:hypothetical protein